MITVDQIRVALERVIHSEISLDNFDEWLTRESWNMHQDSSAKAIEMIGKIELLLSDYDAESISESRVIEDFKELLKDNFRVLSAPAGASISASGSSNRLRRQPVRLSH